MKYVIFTIIVLVLIYAMLRVRTAGIEGYGGGRGGGGRGGGGMGGGGRGGGGGGRGGGGRGGWGRGGRGGWGHHGGRGRGWRWWNGGNGSIGYGPGGGWGYPWYYPWYYLYAGEVPYYWVGKTITYGDRICQNVQTLDQVYDCFPELFELSEDSQEWDNIQLS